MLLKIKYILATGFGSGYLPVVPGTAGSLLAWLFFVLIPLPDWQWLLVTAGTIVLGLWVSPAIEAAKGKDPGLVVIDEFAGQWLSLLFLPRNGWILIGGFLLFRLFDILKPFPAAQCEKIAGGAGIMLDDLVAAVYVNILLQIIVRLVY